MSLLRDIQDAAIDSKIEVAVLLRKCKVLSARLGSAEFNQWVGNELNGYKSKDALPDYRILDVNSKGNFAGPFGTGLNNADIPLHCIPKEYRDNLEFAYLMEPVASMEALVAQAKGGFAQEPWSPDLVAFVARKIYKDMNCLQAWKVIPATAIIAALDAVRNRILSFALEIEAEAPAAGDAPINSNPVPQERVHQIFNTYIIGNVQNVATGSTNVRQKAKHDEQSADDLFAKLLDALSKSGAEKAIVDESISSVEEMRASHGTASFRQHYLSFMSILADHMQVLGPIVAPFLPAVSALLT